MLGVGGDWLFCLGPSYHNDLAGGLAVCRDAESSQQRNAGKADWLSNAHAEEGALHVRHHISLLRPLVHSQILHR